MASEASAICNGNIDVLSWLKYLPVAPEYHPTLAEFQDPIAYIFKIEKEASKYGICKIIPPLPPPSKKTALFNLNKSLVARSGTPTFTTRQQQIGFCPRKHHRPVQKPVWQSGETYTVPQFETKAKAFEKSYLRRCPKKNLGPLEVETLYWKATADKPFSVEYANDMPGSAFIEKKSGGVSDSGYTNNSGNVGETEWNMRGVSRAKGSLLRFMKEEIPGVTSPMVYIAMLFSWFAWHVEDHDLHSLNYLHMGAAKTWYGVPRDAAVAFEEVVRMHGYSGEINPLVTFATLGEKTTVMSPEVLVNAGVPCCRLVQNAGEFVVTFPGAYHSGFSHGFNCGEASNIATPEWLRVAKDAAIRRASINCPPMVSHYQLLYDLAVSLCSRVPKGIHMEPRSSRLKDKKKGEGEMLVKEIFVQDVMHNNYLFHILRKGSSVILLPQSSLGGSIESSSISGSQLRLKARMFHSVCTTDLVALKTRNLQSDDSLLNGERGSKQVTRIYSRNNKFSHLSDSDRLVISGRDDNILPSFASPIENGIPERKQSSQSDKLPDQGLFSCVTCGILCFACVAILQPTEAAARYLMSADCSILDDFRATSDFFVVDEDADPDESHLFVVGGRMVKRRQKGLFDVPIQHAGQIQTVEDDCSRVVTNCGAHKDTSSLGLLAMAYGNSSDSEQDEVEAVEGCHGKSGDRAPETGIYCNDTGLTYDETTVLEDPSSSIDGGNNVRQRNVEPCVERGVTRVQNEDQKQQTDHSLTEVDSNKFIPPELNTLRDRLRQQMKYQYVTSPSTPGSTSSGALLPLETTESAAPLTDEDCSRMHVFCLEHAAEIEKQLRSIGGAQVLLLCHPDYPKLEAQAKKVAEELESDYLWGEIPFREARREDEGMIQRALDSEEAIHGNGDWAVKLGINLYYSANLSRSPLYSKQMPYNSTIYNVFGRNSPANTTRKHENNEKGSGRQKKLLVAGKWCGKVWMSNQVHPLLVERDSEKQEVETYVSPQVKPDVKLERASESIQSAELASTSCRSARKRKHLAAEDDLNIIDESPKAEDSDQTSEGSLINRSRRQCKSNVKKMRMKEHKRVKKETPECQNNGGRNKKHTDLPVDDELEGGPSTRLRRRSSKPNIGMKTKPVETKLVVKKQPATVKKAKRVPVMKASGVKESHAKNKDEEAEYLCDMEGCTMSFGSKHELVLHKRNICPVKGCGKKFFSHKYLVQHRRVHMDDRPLKCPWKGCKMTFKWAWARTEHIRVHTGARPYVCTEVGCGQTFRFVSDFSRHKRKTGHSSKKSRG